MQEQLSSALESFNTQKIQLFGKSFSLGEWTNELRARFMAFTQKEAYRNLEKSKQNLYKELDEIVRKETSTKFFLDRKKTRALITKKRTEWFNLLEQAGDDPTTWTPEQDETITAMADEIDRLEAQTEAQQLYDRNLEISEELTNIGRELMKLHLTFFAELANTDENGKVNEAEVIRLVNESNEEDHQKATQLISLGNASLTLSEQNSSKGQKGKSKKTLN
jgi:hypothetical protein